MRSPVPQEIEVCEKLLRVYPVTFSGRTLTQDVEMRWIRMKKGDKITSILPAAHYYEDRILAGWRGRPEDRAAHLVRPCPVHARKAGSAFASDCR